MSQSLSTLLLNTLSIYFFFTKRVHTFRAQYKQANWDAVFVLVTTSKNIFTVCTQDQNPPATTQDTIATIQNTLATTQKTIVTSQNTIGTSHSTIADNEQWPNTLATIQQRLGNCPQHYSTGPTSFACQALFTFLHKTELLIILAFVNSCIKKAKHMEVIAHIAHIVISVLYRLCNDSHPNHANHCCVLSKTKIKQWKTL